MESIVRAVERHRAAFVIIDVTGVTSVRDPLALPSVVVSGAAWSADPARLRLASAGLTVMARVGSSQPESTADPTVRRMAREYLYLGRSCFLLPGDR